MLLDGELPEILDHLTGHLEIGKNKNAKNFFKNRNKNIFQIAGSSRLVGWILGYLSQVTFYRFRFSISVVHVWFAVENAVSFSVVDVLPVVFSLFLFITRLFTFFLHL